MHVDLDARVVTSDGHDVGRIKHAILDPNNNNEVAAFVVSTGGLLGRDVIIARQEIDSARPDGDAIRLELSKQRFDDLPTLVPHEYTAPPAGHVPAEPHGYPDSAYLWPIPVPGAPAGDVFPTPDPRRASDPDLEPPKIDQGTKVVDRNGDEVGVVEDLLFDEQTGKLRALVVALGGGLQRLFGASRTVRISASLVERVSYEVVHLRTVREQIDANS